MSQDRDRSKYTLRIEGQPLGEWGSEDDMTRDVLRILERIGKADAETDRIALGEWRVRTIDRLGKYPVGMKWVAGGILMESKAATVWDGGQDEAYREAQRVVRIVAGWCDELRIPAHQIIGRPWLAEWKPAPGKGEA